MVKRNPNFAEFPAHYLFVEIANRQKAFFEANPDARLISLGIGDTTEPLPSPIVKRMLSQVEALGTRQGYSGYPPYNGSEDLRSMIVDVFYKNCNIEADEIFISDGSKPDLARLQLLFGPNCTVAVQEPVYPAYVDGCVISGKAGKLNPKTGQYTNLVYMPCVPDNDFFPNLSDIARTDLIFFCSPNNPTGAAANKSQLTSLVEFAARNKSIIVFDSAYSGFITETENIPSTIFCIPGARNLSIETSSFSKLCGFTGVRLGWTVVPKSVCYENGSRVWDDWARVMGTCFNGSSNISERGGVACLTPEGRLAMKQMISVYLNNAALLRSTMERLGFECHGGVNSPYIWVHMAGKDSWGAFQEILEKAHIVTTPGVGFGKEGDQFLRLSAFARPDDVSEAIARLTKALSRASE